MTIAIFGGTGGIGKIIIHKALDKGYRVNAYVRNPDKLNINHPNLHVIKGELDNYDNIKNTISGSDVVISTLGPPLLYKYKGQPLLIGHKLIIQSMKELNILRFITLATPSVKSEKDKRSFATILPGIIARLIYPSAYKEIIDIGKTVVASNLDWTIIRIIAPNDNPPINNIKVSFGDIKIKFAISRADIADFILEQITNKSYIRLMPIIGS
ncbi:MAG: NAD(P)H-binding protein [Prevotella sp.]|jgi:hypothetical protein|nr:NAD(P)H-binding protein [Prevotella sp.]